MQQNQAGFSGPKEMIVLIHYMWVTMEIVVISHFLVLYSLSALGTCAISLERH